MVGVAVCLLATLPLLARHRAPRAALVAVLAATVALVALDYAVLTAPAPAIVLATLAERDRRQDALLDPDRLHRRLRGVRRRGLGSLRTRAGRVRDHRAPVGGRLDRRRSPTPHTAAGRAGARACRARAAPRGRRGANADRSRVARLGRTRDQLDPHPSRSGAARPGQSAGAQPRGDRDHRGDSRARACRTSTRSWADCAMARRPTWSRCPASTASPRSSSATRPPAWTSRCATARALSCDCRHRSIAPPIASHRRR